MLRILILSLFVLPTASQASVPAYPMKAEKVAENVYAILSPSRDFPNKENKGWNSNSAFVVTKEGVLLFDTGTSTAIGESIKKVIAGVTDKPVKWIINSHGHGDHWLGNAAFKKTVKKIYASDTVAKIIKDDGKTWVDRFDKMTEGITGNSEIVQPTDALKERAELTLGGKKVVLFPSNNSHSKGDIIAWLPDDRILFTGDVMYIDRAPSTFASDLTEWIKTLEVMEKLNPAVVVPGHGIVGSKKDLTNQRQLFLDMWAAVEKGLDDGKADFEMYPEVNKALAKYRKQFPGLEEKLKRDISFVYLQVEAAAFK